MEIPEIYAGLLKKKMVADVFFALQQNRELKIQEFTGIIEKTIGEINVLKYFHGTRSLAQVVVKNPNHMIKLDMTAWVNVEIKKEALIVDKKALIKEGENYYVFKVINNQVKKVEIEVKNDQTKSVLIFSNELHPNDQVVTSEVDQLNSGDYIRILDMVQP